MERLVSLPDRDADLLALARPEGPPPGARGLFTDASWLRRVSGQGAVLFGGGCALLLEVAHPLVAAGVAEHSDYRADPFGRLGRTLAAMNAMAFGSVAEALAAARAVHRRHGAVRGVLATPVGRFPAGRAYAAREPALVLWVWATLAETARAVYETFVEALSPDALEGYHADYAVLARLLGVPPGRVPGSRDAFASYFDGVVNGGDLAVGAAARDIARTVLDAPAALGGGRVRAVTTALLPEPLRAAYGLPWGDARQRRFDAFAASIRALRSSRGGAASVEAALDAPEAGR